LITVRSQSCLTVSSSESGLVGNNMRIVDGKIDHVSCESIAVNSEGTKAL
jgi:hypothetical protein